MNVAVFNTISTFLTMSLLMAKRSMARLFEARLVCPDE